MNLQKVNSRYCYSDEYVTIVRYLSATDSELHNYSQLEKKKTNLHCGTAVGRGQQETDFGNLSVLCWF